MCDDSLSLSLSLSLSVSLSLRSFLPPSHSLTHSITNTHNTWARAGAYTHAHTHARTHARTHTHTHSLSLSLSGASLWNFLPQKIKSCISLPCFKRNLHKYMSENNLSSNLDGFVWISRLSKNLIVVYIYRYIYIYVCPWNKFISDVSVRL